jgi:hypothetical protein
MAHGGAAARQSHRSKVQQGGRGGTRAPRLRGKAGARKKEKRKAAIGVQTREGPKPMSEFVLHVP